MSTGRSLFVKRLHSQLKMQFNGAKVTRKVVRLIDPQVDENEVLGSLLPFLDAQYQRRPIIFHFDVTSSVSRASLIVQIVKKLPAMQETQIQSLVGKIAWRKEWLPTPVFLSGEFHGQRSLTGYIIVHGVAKSQTQLSTNIFTFTFTSVSCPQVLAEWLGKERHSFHILPYPIPSVKNFFFLHALILSIIVKYSRIRRPLGLGGLLSSV